MRYGIFSDTHANLPALEAVMRAFEAEKIDALICLGDTVGYGSQPNECCDIVRRVAKYTILGNHDAAVAGRMDYSYYYDAAREALDYHRGILSEENHAWLRSLPYIEKDAETHFCHGSPVDSTMMCRRPSRSRQSPGWRRADHSAFCPGNRRRRLRRQCRGRSRPGPQGHGRPCSLNRIIPGSGATGT